MQNPENLAVARMAREVAVDVYAFARTLPTTERFNLATQMTRAATSILSNINEGCGRHGNHALVPFLHYANASARELSTQLRLARDVDVGDRIMVRRLLRRTERLRYLLTKLIKAIRA